MSNIGFIGLGIMGRPMVANLAGKGFSVYVNDIDENALKETAQCGAIPSDYKTMGEKCDTIFLSLPNGETVGRVIFGENSLSTYVREGTVIADTSSITANESRAIYQKLKAQGVGFIDCPVSGGEPGAINGTLAFMAGGDEADFEALKPYYDAMGSSAVLVGTSGDGSVAKLANQVIVNLTIAAVSEAMVLAAKCNADPEKVFQAIRGGLAGSAVLEAKAPMMIGRNFTPGGTITINRKDIKNVMDTAYAADVPMPLTSQLLEIMQGLKVAGNMGDDHSVIVRHFERLAGIEL